MRFPKVKWRDVGKCVLIIIASGFLGAVVGLALSLAYCAQVEGAEYTLTWQPSATGAPPIFYEVFRGPNFHAGTYETSVTVYADSGRAYFKVRASNDYGVSDFTPVVSGRTVDVLPGYACDTTAVYIAPLNLLVVLHPNKLDSLLVTCTDTSERVYWHSYLDFVANGWINLSDVAEFGLRYLIFLDEDYKIVILSKGDLGLADLLTLGALLNHGPAWRELEFTK